MDSTLEIGHRRPVEQDALRLLIIVHQLGEQAGREWLIETESQLQHLDHLVRHPVDLAYLLMDLIETRQPELDSRLPELADRTRQLLGRQRSTHRRQVVQRPFDQGSWERWDEPLAYLGCRDLLRVESLDSPDLRFRLTDRGAAWLDQTVYPTVRSIAHYLERCELLRDILPAQLLRPNGAPPLGDYLRQADQRIEDFRQDENIRIEDDMLALLFQATFTEPL